MSIEELDLRILKGITSNKVAALSFCYKYEYFMFDIDVQRTAKYFMDYVKSYQSPPTRRTLLECNSKVNDVERQSINDLWDELDEYNYDLKELSYDTELFKRRYQEKEIELVRQEVEKEGDKSPEDFVKRISLRLQKVAALDLERAAIHKTVGEYLPEFEEKYKAIVENSSNIQCIKTGFSGLDSLTGGIGGSEFWMIGGATNSGKSMILNNISINAWLNGNTIDTPKNELKKGYSILFFSLEMPYEDCFNRFMGCLADVPYRNLSAKRSEPLTEEEEARLEKAKKFIKDYEELGCYFDIVDGARGMTIQQVELKLNDAMLKYQPDIIVIDYMTLMSCDISIKEDWLRVGMLAGSLAQLFKNYRIAGLSAAQLTDIKRSGKEVSEDVENSLSRFGRSSLIAHHLNLAIIISSRINEELRSDMSYHVVKNRAGPKGQGFVIKNFKNARLIDVPNIEKQEESTDIQALINRVKNRREMEDIEKKKSVEK